MIASAQFSLTTIYSIMVLVPILASLVGYGVYCFHLRDEQTVEATDRLLFQLSKLHGISASHQVLLQTIAESVEIANSAVLFAIPETFDAAVETMVRQNRLSVAEQKAIAQLRRQMFT